MQLTIAENMEGLQKALMPLMKEGKRSALVPTLGNLHDGHLALVHAAKQHADTVILSIFVNPRQFGALEDFGNYPRTLEADIKKTDEAGVTIVYTPSLDDIYPEGYLTNVSVGPLGEILCGAFRPGHFDGVATVVTKLFLRVLPHIAVFGEKDYQQLCIVRRVAYDLDIPVEVLSVPTVREESGLAMSSRNAYLTPEERKLAPKLHETLVQVAARLAGGVPIPDACAEGARQLDKLGFKVEYIELREADSLNALEKFTPPARLLAAAWLGKTRLIDNIGLE